MEKKVWELKGGGNTSVWEMLDWLSDVFAYIQKFLFYFLFCYVCTGFQPP